MTLKSNRNFLKDLMDYIGNGNKQPIEGYCSSLHLTNEKSQWMSMMCEELAGLCTVVCRRHKQATKHILS